MLPELPGALVCELADVVVGNPIGVAFKLLCIEVLDFELVVCIDDGRHLIADFDGFKPGKGSLLELIGC